MTQSLDLGSFLQEQASQGETDSQGQFKVSHTEAARKLARFALPNLYSWALKLVQAAVCWQAESLKITQTRNFTSFFFCPSDLSNLPLIEDVITTLVSGNIAGSAPIERLSIALRALVEQADFSFVLAINDGAEARSIYAGRDMASLSDRERERTAHLEEPGLQLVVSLLKSGETVTGRIAGGFLVSHRRDIELARELRQKAFLAPIPIVLDGRRLDGVLDKADYGNSASRKLVLMSGVSPFPDWPALPVPEEFEEKVMSLETDPRRASRSYNGRRDFQAWYLIRLKNPDSLLPPRKEVVFCWVNDGVLVERETAILSTDSQICDFTVFVNAAGLQCDLTGFSLVESAEKTLRGRSVFAALASELALRADQTARFFEEDRDELSGEDEKIRRWEKSLERCKRLPILAAPLLATAFFPVVGTVATMGLGTLVYASAHWPKPHRRAATRMALEEAIREDYERVIQLSRFKDRLRRLD